jgi:hypothetical protein
MKILSCAKTLYDRKQPDVILTSEEKTDHACDEVVGLSCHTFLPAKLRRPNRVHESTQDILGRMLTMCKWLETKSQKAAIPYMATSHKQKWQNNGKYARKTQKSSVYRNVNA